MAKSVSYSSFFPNITWLVMQFFSWTSWGLTQPARLHTNTTAFRGTGGIQLSDVCLQSTVSAWWRLTSHKHFCLLKLHFSSNVTGWLQVPRPQSDAFFPSFIFLNDHTVVMLNNRHFWKVEKNPEYWRWLEGVEPNYTKTQLCSVSSCKETVNIRSNSVMSPHGVWYMNSRWDPVCQAKRFDQFNPLVSPMIQSGVSDRHPLWSQVCHKKQLLLVLWITVSSQFSAKILNWPVEHQTENSTHVTLSFILKLS